MDLVELLMAEHASLRVHLSHFRDAKLDSFFEVDDFVNTGHAMVEDVVVFPLLSGNADDSTVVAALNRLEDEHGVLNMLSGNMRAFLAEEIRDLDPSRVALYVDTLESHNASEETTVFRRWRDLSAAQKQVAAARAGEIVDSFGLDRYLRATGFSREFLSTVPRS